MTQQEINDAFDKFCENNKFHSIVCSRESFVAGIFAFKNWQIKLREQRLESPNVEEYYKYIVNPEEATINVMPNFDGVSKQEFEHVEVKMVHHKEVRTPSLFEIPSQPTVGVAVDCGSVNGKNPGLFEYRLVDIATKKIIKNVVISGDSTNNIS